MNESIVAILEQARLFVEQHAPSDWLREAIPFGIICLTVGIGLSVLGAKLSRFGFAFAFSLLGAWVGVYCADQIGFSRPVFGFVGAGMLALIAFQTFRLWVGVMAALVFASTAVGIFGYQRVVPHVDDFRQTVVVSEPVGAGSFGLPTPSQQQNYLHPSPQQWIADLWTFVTQRDASAAGTGRAIVIGSLLTGLCLGVVAVRWAMILSTAVLGTALITTASTTLLMSLSPSTYQALQQRPVVGGAAIGALLVASLVLQTMLTRQPKSESAEPRRKS